MQNIIHSGENMSLSDNVSKQRGIFNDLPQEMKAELLFNKHLRKFKNDQFLQQRGDTGRGFWLIEKGLVRIGRYLEHGQLQVLLILVQGDSFGELSCFSRNPRPVDAIATGDVEAYWISCDELMAAMEKYPSSKNSVIATVADMLQFTLETLLMHRIQSAYARLKWNLRFFCIDKVAPIDLPLSQNDLADMVGVTRATIVHALKDMEEEGIIERKYGLLRILDPSKLDD